MPTSLREKLLARWPATFRERVIYVERSDFPTPAATRLTTCKQLLVVANPTLLASLNVSAEVVGEHELLHVTCDHVYTTIDRLDELALRPRKSLLPSELEEMQRLNERRLVAADCEVNSRLPELQTPPFVYPQMYNLPRGETMPYYWAHLPRLLGNAPANRGKCGFGHQTQKALEEICKELGKKLDSSRSGGSDLINSLQPPADTKAQAKPAAVAQRLARYVGREFSREFEARRTRLPHKARDEGFARRKRFAPRITWAVDCSGSVQGNELAAYFAALNWLLREYQGEVLEFDTQIRHRGRSLSGNLWGGGTDFYPVGNEARGELTVIFTDGEGPWPATWPTKLLVVQKAFGGRVPPYAEQLLL